MATSVYESKYINLIDGTELYLTPLKIKYLRQFMQQFEVIKNSKNDDQAFIELTRAALIAMKQYCPSINTLEMLEDSVDLKTVYTILEIGGGVKMKNQEEVPINQRAKESEGSWDTLDLAKLESEAFLLGIWKDYEELEMSLSMPELIAILDSKRDLDYQEKKFFAAIQGVDLDEQTGKKEEDPWEAMKARVFGGGQAANSNDVVSLQGPAASKAGFGIGMGLDYEDLTKK